jgi:hypothetical protein
MKYIPGVVLSASLSLFTLSLVPCFAQGDINPQDPPRFRQGNGTWSSWTRSAKFPHLSLRGACGDNTTLNGMPMFSLVTQVRNDYGYSIALVWAVEFYNKRLDKNVIQGAMLEHMESGTITQAGSVLKGTCQGLPETFYARFDCAVHDGSESTCWMDWNGNSLRPDGTSRRHFLQVTTKVLRPEGVGNRTA